MHLINDFVLWDQSGPSCFVHVGPRPGPRVRVAFDEDYGDVAPTSRIPLIAAWFKVGTKTWSMSWYSLFAHILWAWFRVKRIYGVHTGVEDDLAIRCELTGDILFYL